MCRILGLCGLFLVSTVLMGQAPNEFRSWRAIGKKSTKIVVGVVGEKRLWVIQPAKVAPPPKEVRPKENATVVVPLQNPAEYIVGQIFRVRVHEVIKDDGHPRVGSLVTIFTPGFFSTEGRAALVEKQRYVFFLAPLKPDGNRFSGTTITDPSNSLAEKKDFDPTSVYSIVGGSSGAVPLRAGERGLLNEIKAGVGDRQ